jgi:voltage-gated potassium channel Kch
LATLVVLLLATGTYFYHQVEDFGWIDSLYFTVITLTTVGYGDLAPSTAPGKVFTTVYVLIGVGILIAFVAEVATAAARVQSERSDRKRRKGG